MNVMLGCSLCIDLCMELSVLRDACLIVCVHCF